MIGIDLIKTSRMERLIERFGEKGLRKFLSQNEIKLISSHKTAAGFWAIKEAFSKALGTGFRETLNFKDISITNNKHGKPSIKINNKACLEIFS